MIIVDSTPSSPSKVTSSQGPISPITTDFTPPPPAYGSSARDPLIPREPGEPAGKRFIVAFVYAVIICMAVGTIVDGMFGPPHGGPFDWVSGGMGPPPEPQPDDGTPVACRLPWETAIQPELPQLNRGGTPPSMLGSLPRLFPPYEAQTSIDLPTDSPLLFMLARGSLSSGTIRFETYEADPGEKIKVTVNVRYWSYEARDRANVCMLKRQEGAYGLGIFTNQRWPHRIDEMDQLHFFVTVAFPVTNGTTLALGSFTTFLPQFKHEIGNLSGLVTFDSLKLQASNAVMKAESIQAAHVSLKTSNSAITGVFNVTDSLALITQNGYIDADIDLRNEDHHQATVLTLQTSNARINTAVSLHSTRHSRLLGLGGWFSITAQTNNGRINMTFPASPSASHLNLDARTSNAITDVALHAAFEGSFKLFTSNSPVQVDQNKDVTDPTGHGLNRTVELDRLVRGVAEGRIWWGGERDHRELGTVSVRTTNGRNALRV